MPTSTQLHRIKAISFDGDMTLWDFDKVMRHSLGIALRELRRRLPGPATDALTIDKMIEIRHGVAADLRGKVANLEEVRLHAFQRTVEHVGGRDQDLAAELNALYLKHRFEDIEPYPDVHPTLDSLGRRYTLGLLSNGNGYPERCGLPDRFSFVVFSQDVGFGKPDGRIFLAACRQARCEPEELMHVGDSLASDVQGANAIGAVSVWLNRDGKDRQGGIEPDLEIRSLTDLIPLLGLMIPKVLAYIIREASPEMEVLVFERLDEPYEPPQVPGGGVHEGEDLVTAVLREVMEETGIADAVVVRQVAKAPFHAEWRGEWQERNVFLLAAPPHLPDRWRHTVTDGTEDKGLGFALHWLPLSVAKRVLRWGQGQWLDRIERK